MSKWFLLIIAGSAGTLARYFLSGAAYSIFGARFPYGTLIVNVAGCFLMGVFIAISEEKFALSSDLKLFILIGFLGAFTTFSTFILETANLMKEGQSLLAFWNVFLSVVAGFFMLRLGILLGKII